MTELDSRPGTYILVLTSTARISLAVGRLGQLDVQPGYYLYVGSALGPGGLQSRVNRHLRSSSFQPSLSQQPLPQQSKSLHWHIDYLRAVLPVAKVWYTYSMSRLEHEWANAILNAPGATIPLSRFGASDCRCPAHLFHFEEKPAVDIVGSGVNVEQFLVSDA